MKHRFCAAALAAVLLLSAAPLSPAASAAFSDAEGTWAAEVIEKAEGYGLMNGYPDGTFGVGKELTRGEFVAVLCRMFGWDAASPGAPSFSDCPASHWAYSYVETALAHGVMDAGGAFRPEDYISREEMAVMLVRALGYGTLAQSLSGLELPFDDVTDNRGYVAIAYDIGMITGVAGAGGQLKFLPRDSATREEAAAMLVRVYERYTSKLDWLHGFYAFSSYSQIDLTASMDAVSVGWARMEYDPAAGPVLNSSRTNGNDWVRPDARHRLLGCPQPPLQLKCICLSGRFHPPPRRHHHLHGGGGDRNARGPGPGRGRPGGRQRGLRGPDHRL